MTRFSRLTPGSHLCFMLSCTVGLLEPFYYIYSVTVRVSLTVFSLKKKKSSSMSKEIESSELKVFKITWF
jgi:hypothetical protein